MARITNFIYCLNTIINENEANVIGVLSAITPEYVPGTFSFSVFCSIVDLEEGNHTVKMIFMNCQDEVPLIELEGVIPYQIQPGSNLSEKYMGINVSSNWQNIVFEKSGLYKTIVMIDEKECGAYDIYVKGKNEVK